MESPAALAERTNTLLKAFTEHPFKAEELRRAVPLRAASVNALQQSQHTENFTRFTDREMTGLTGHSDSGLVMDPEDRDRAVEDLQAFKDFVSTLKFAYLESNVKIEFLSHIMDKDGPRIISMEETNALEQKRLKTKAELKERKRRAAELESLIRQEAENLQTRYEKSNEEAHLAAQLLRECETMELELAMLKNKRTATQRITIEEAQVLCEEQEMKLATYGPEIKAAERKMKETGQRIRAHKSAIEKLVVVNRDLTKEQEHREATGKRDERAEEGCRWYTNSTKLYSAILGIRNAYTVPGGPHGEMRIEYEGPQGHAGEGNTRTLSIVTGPDGRMTNASLVDSSESIVDIVNAHLASQDIPSLIQEVRAQLDVKKQV